MRRRRDISREGVTTACASHGRWISLHGRTRSRLAVESRVSFLFIADSRAASVLHTRPCRPGAHVKRGRTLGELFPHPPFPPLMSSSNAENATAASHQDAHHIAAKEATSEDVIISIAPHQGTLKKLATSYHWGAMDGGHGTSDARNLVTGDEGETSPNKVEVVGDIPPFDTLAVVAETGGPTEPELMKDTMAPTSTVDLEVLKVAALEDANRILGATLSIDLDKVGVKDARIIMSEEHKSLGYRPPPDSLAAKAQRSSTKHPDSSLGLDAATLREAARADAERIK